MCRNHERFGSVNIIPNNNNNIEYFIFEGRRRLHNRWVDFGEGVKSGVPTRTVFTEIKKKNKIKGKTLCAAQ